MSINHHHIEGIGLEVASDERAQVSSEESKSRPAGRSRTQSANRPTTREGHGETCLPIRERREAVGAGGRAIRRVRSALPASLQPVKTGVMPQ
jgi:hypothetical protein